MNEPNRPLPLDTLTRWGKIAAVGCKDGERYYMALDRHGEVTMLAGDDLEAEIAEEWKR